jgi:hypothetical protein
MLSLLLLLPTMSSAKTIEKDEHPKKLKAVWSYDPVNAAKPMEVDNSGIERSYLITKDGEKIPWSREEEQDAGDVTTMDFCDQYCNTFYDWYYYDDDYSQVDQTHFYIGEVSASNLGSGTGTIQYIQTNSSTTTWIHTGRVSTEAEFGNALIAKAKVAVGYDVSRQRQNYSSNTTSSTYTVPPHSKAYIKAYNYGVYSGGRGVWKAYDESDGGHTFIGNYTEIGNAWTVANNQIHYEFDSWPI